MPQVASQLFRKIRFCCGFTRSTIPLREKKEIHAWLRDADHLGGRTRRAGSEWFVTSTKFLDRVAKAMGLEVRVINDFEAGED